LELLEDVVTIDAKADLNDYGLYTITMKLVPLNKNSLNKPQKVTLRVLGAGQPVKEMSFEVSGVGFSERRRALYQELAGTASPQKASLQKASPQKASPQKEGELSGVKESKKITGRLRRREWLEDLMKHVQLKDLKNELRVYFHGMEKDYGGLRREIYDLTGRYMKDPKNQLFVVGNQGRVYISPNAVPDQKRIKIMQYLGAILANSIKYKGLVGVDLAPGLVKALYVEPISYDDLETVMDKQLFDNYKSLRTMEATDLLSLDLRFSMHNQEIVQGGADKIVDKSNVEDYLQRIATHYLNPRKGELVKAFRQGFEAVIPINILKKHTRPNELHYLTRGVEEVTGEKVLRVITFQNASPIVVSYFKQFLLESDQETLRKFLRFATGASSLPVDPSDISIVVEFKKRDVDQLPVAHTCLHRIDLPEYKSFIQLRNKINTALNYASEGFGIL